MPPTFEHPFTRPDLSPQPSRWRPIAIIAFAFGIFFGVQGFLCDREIDRDRELRETAGAFRGAAYAGAGLTGTGSSGSPLTLSAVPGEHATWSSDDNRIRLSIDWPNVDACPLYLEAAQRLKKSGATAATSAEVARLARVACEGPISVDASKLPPGGIWVEDNRFLCDPGEAVIGVTPDGGIKCGRVP